MTYPLDFATYTLESSDGHRSNKFYHATLVVSQNQNAIIVRRWGKIGSPGELKIEKFAIQKKAESEFEKLVRSKLGKGYTTKSSNIKQINAQDELRLAFGPGLWPRLPGSALEHILPGIDITGRRELSPPRYDENGKYLGEPPPRVYSKTEIEKARQAQAAAEREETARTYASNPRFGLF